MREIAQTSLSYRNCGRFLNSESAKIEWEKLVGSSWKSYSDTKWYSKFEVLKDVYLKIPYFKILIKNGICVGNANALRTLLEDQLKNWFVQIELASYEPFYKFCYGLEGDGQLVFIVGQKLDELYTLFEGGNRLPELPSARHLIADAVSSVG